MIFYVIACKTNVCQLEPNAKWKVAWMCSMYIHNYTIYHGKAKRNNI